MALRTKHLCEGATGQAEPRGLKVRAGEIKPRVQNQEGHNQGVVQKAELSSPRVPHKQESSKAIVRSQSKGHTCKGGAKDVVTESVIG